MTRLSLLLAAALSAAVAAPAIAQDGSMRAEFAAPFARDIEVIVDGKLWQCSGTACVARGDDPRPAVACRKLSRKAGAVTRFSTSRAELDAAGLAACNQDRR